MKQLYKQTLAGILTLVLTVAVLPQTAAAQIETEAPDSAGSEEFKMPETGTRIWTGTAGLFRQSYYRYNADGQLEQHSQTTLDLEFRTQRFLSPSWSAGMQGVSQVFMSGTFGNIGLGSIGAGPLLRFYPLAGTMNGPWQIYSQAGFLAGYNMALGDAYGANAGEGFRLRSGLRAGAAYRFSNAFGIYLETGPDWEADESFRFDSRAWQLEIGIQLFRF